MGMMKAVVTDIMDLYEAGKTITEIAEILEYLGVDRDMVERVVEEYSNFYD